MIRARAYPVLLAALLLACGGSDGPGHGATLGPSCTAFVACCDSLEASNPQFANACDSVRSSIMQAENNGTNASAYESSCEQGLSAFHASGSCTGSAGSDAGTTGDGGTTHVQPIVCPAGTVICGNDQWQTCSDLATDRANCGQCGNVLGEHASCVAGKPVCDDASLMLCGNTCSTLTSDPANCGGCGHACPMDAACDNGACHEVAGWDPTGATTTTSCDAICTGIGAHCSDVAAFPCYYDGTGDLESDGECGTTMGTSFDNSGIPGGGGSSGTKWYGDKCNRELSSSLAGATILCNCVF